MALTLPNLQGWLGAMRTHVTAQEKKIEKLRQEVAEALLEELFKNIPVWSGRTISSIQVSNGGGVPSKEAHPDRHNTSSKGYYTFHPEFGFTNRMALGSEPKRSGAEAIARASVATASYKMNSKVYVVANSTAWSLIESGQAPDHDPHKPRNQGVVSNIAVAAVRSKFRGQVK